jgi:hypothetical protein
MSSCFQEDIFLSNRFQAIASGFANSAVAFSVFFLSPRHDG